jgi:hypothetical protein
MHHRAEKDNWVLQELRETIMFELTELTRKDKYIMLADNKDVVPRTPNKF